MQASRRFSPNPTTLASQVNAIHSRLLGLSFRLDACIGSDVHVLVQRMDELIDFVKMAIDFSILPLPVELFTICTKLTLKARPFHTSALSAHGFVQNNLISSNCTRWNVVIPDNFSSIPSRPSLLTYTSSM
ncbi:unnamed protein product [Protopolystoma xenopodis]|uniref:Uncharacterized protein n=1 Tax=Protopolystoma xenopodis TaxID=117903 RepID=A0A448X8Z3_9PLAT|nr:unnamed protein product [Protopolystoma xenopodis]